MEGPKRIKEDLKARTKQFALGVIRLTEKLPKTRVADVLGKQVLRSATSVGANYRSACRSRSPADFISRITIVEEEADETQYWLDLIEEAELIKPELLQDLKKEASELTAIFTATGRTARQGISRAKI